MISLTVQKGTVEINNNGKKEDFAGIDAYKPLKNLRLGTTITVKSNNSRVEKHSGQYYMLFLQEFDEVVLFYLDKQGVLRQIFNGYESETAKAIYQNIADDTQIKVLKSSNKKAYRVVYVNSESDKNVLTFPYKNKSSELISQTYLDLYTAIKYAARLYRLNSQRIQYNVITPKDTVLFQIG